jgi:hypothetical protein
MTAGLATSPVPHNAAIPQRQPCSRAVEVVSLLPCLGRFSNKRIGMMDPIYPRPPAAPGLALLAGVMNPPDRR